jgi:NAD(P)-dependent dehydrogenase (short-subunit alcohol dehydrogenase family)
MKPKPIKEQVVAVIGAETRVGRLAALELARQGARVAISAPTRTEAEVLAEELRGCGVKVVGLGGDVGVFANVSRLAETAERELGGLDTWVQVADLSVSAPFDRMTPAELSRLISSGLVAQAYGALAAVPVMKRRGGGQLIHVSTVQAEVPLGFHGAYVAARQGVAGMLDSLRSELARQNVPIAVTSIVPASIDTAVARAVSSDPAEVARAIVEAVSHPRREIVVSPSSRFIIALHGRFPRLVEAMLLRSPPLRTGRRRKGARAGTTKVAPGAAASSQAKPAPEPFDDLTEKDLDLPEREEPGVGQRPAAGETSA